MLFLLDLFEILLRLWEGSINRKDMLIFISIKDWLEAETTVDSSFFIYNRRSIMNKASEARPGYQLSSHEFSDDTVVYFESSPGKESGWYFSDCTGALFGPIHDETTAHKILAELSALFNNQRRTTQGSWSTSIRIGYWQVNFQGRYKSSLFGHTATLLHSMNILALSFL